MKGNDILEGEYTFEVAPETTDPGEILYWRLADALDAYNIDELLPHGDDLTTSALAWRIDGNDPAKGERPSGGASRTAKQLRDRWEGDGLITTYKGERGSIHMLRTEKTG